MSNDIDFTREHDHVEPLLAEHALGTTEPAERGRIDSHVADCASCRLTFGELVEAVSGMERAVHAPSIEPRSDARAALVDAARRTPQEAVGVAGSSPRRKPRWSRRWVRVAAPTLAGVALLVTGWNQARRIDTLEQRLADARGDQVPVLKGASIDDLEIGGGAFGDTRAQVVIKRDAGIITFRDVPAPPDGLAWNVAAVDGDERLHALGSIAEGRELAIVAIEGIDPEDIERIIVTSGPRDDAAEGELPAEIDTVAEGTI